VPQIHADAKRRQPIRDSRPLFVRAGHHVSEIGEQFGNPAHANPADPDEMNPSRFAEQ
jgi:hypothetical protein